ncbi:hypothetical protein FSP39_020944 [Pinctada imbricata]|uniref:Uncharacterized protein n=1 Tax=Pinctada imbricata TaxID=66713 RepID=A0AA88YS19_PINIB|nr:hypothetical protein FSP39_020944 [Pinctada imbricata]
MDSGQEESDFGIKIDAVFSLASTETEADECSRNATSDTVQADEEKKPKCTGSDSKSCEVRLIDIFDEKIVREYWKIYRGYPFSKQPTSQGSKVEECKNFDVIFAKDAVYERGKRKRKFNAHVKGPEYVESPPSRWMNRKKIKIGPEKSKFKYLKVSPVVIKQKKRVLFERNKHIVSRSVSVERLVEAANHFLSLPGKSKPALVYRPQVARTKKKLRKPDPEINLARTSSPSPPRLEPVSERIETVLDEKPPKLEPEFSDLNLDFEDASLSLSLSGRYRKKNKRLGKEFVTKKKRKVAKVTPLQTKEPGSLASTSMSELQSSTGASSYTPRLQSILKKSPTDHKEVSAEEMSTDFLPARPIKTPEFTAAVNKLAKKENTKKFFQLKIGDKIVLIPTDGNAVMPKAFVLDNPTKSDPTTPIFQTARPVPKETVFGLGSNPIKENVDEESLQAAQVSSDDHSYLQSIKQEPPDDAYIMPNSKEVKSNTEYLTPDHDYMPSKHEHDTTDINDVKPYPADATSFQKDKKPDKKQTTPHGSRYLQYVEASLSPVNPDIVLLRLKSNDKTKAVPKLPQLKKCRVCRNADRKSSFYRLKSRL